MATWRGNRVREYGVNPMFKVLYQIYDRAMTAVRLPRQYCSQCEKKVRYWVYHFQGLTYCQGCADDYVARTYQQINLF